MKLVRIILLLDCLFVALAAHAQTWQEEFARMPLTESVAELNRHNCVKIMLGCGAHTLRFCPPLCITKSKLETGLRIFDEAVAASL